MSRPLVSVVMPAYEAGSTIVEAIRSISEGGVDDCEVIVVDDGSAQPLDEVLKAAELAQPVRYVRLTRNLGEATARNVALSQARGLYIANLDADDLCTGKRLARQVEHLEREPDITFCGSHKTFFGERTDSHRYPEGVETCIAALPLYCCFANPAVMLHRERAGVDLHYDPSFVVGTDYDLWARLFQAGKHGDNLPFVGLRYRVSEGQMTRARAALTFRNDVRVRTRLLSHLFHKADTLAPLALAVFLSAPARWRAEFTAPLRVVLDEVEPEARYRTPWAQTRSRIAHLLEQGTPAETPQSADRGALMNYATQRWGDAFA